MRKLFKINKWSVIATTLLYFTFWGGIFAEYILGLIQIIMTLYLFSKFHRINPISKVLIITYVFLTIGAITYFFGIDHDFEIMFSWILTSMCLAYFHLFITYKIYNYELSNS